MRKIEAAGVGFDSLLNFSPKVEKVSAVRNSFNQILGLNLTKNNMPLSQEAEKKDISSNGSIPSILTNDHFQQLDGRELLNQLSPIQSTNPETIQMVKDLFGISDQKWTSMMEDSNVEDILQKITSSIGIGSQNRFDMLSELNRANKESGDENRFPNDTTIIDLNSSQLQTLKNILGKSQNQTTPQLGSSGKINDVRGLNEQKWLHNLRKINNSATQSTPTNAGKKAKTIQETGLYPNQLLLPPDSLYTTQNILGIDDQKWSELLGQLNNPTAASTPTDVGKTLNLAALSGQSQNQSPFPFGSLESIRNVLGINDEKWSEVLAQLNSQTTPSIPADAGKTATAAALSGQSQNQPVLPLKSMEAIRNILGINDQKWREVLTQLNSQTTQAIPADAEKTPNIEALLGQSQNQPVLPLKSMEAIRNILGINDQKWQEVLTQLNSQTTQAIPAPADAEKTSNIEALLGQSQNQSALPSGSLESIQNVLGINVEKWSEVLAQLNSQTTTEVPASAGKTPNGAALSDQSQNQSALASGSLETIRKALGINDQKWREVLALLNNQTTMEVPADAGKTSNGAALLGQSQNQPALAPGSLETIRKALRINGQKWPEVLALLNNQTTTEVPADAGTTSNGAALSGQSQNQPALAPGSLETIRKALGINDQKWREVLALLNNQPPTEVLADAGKTTNAAALSGQGQNQPALAPGSLETIRKALGINDQKWPEVLALLNNQTTTEVLADAGKTPNAEALLGQSQNQQALPPGNLETIRDALGNNNQKWFDLLPTNSPATTQNGTNHVDMFAAIMKKLPGLDAEQLLSVLNGDTQTFLKSGKMNDLRTSQDVKINANQSLTGQLELVKESPQVITTGLSVSPNGQNPENWFPRPERTWEKQSSESQSNSQLNEKIPLYNTQPFEFHPMTKAQQLSIMLNPPQKPAPSEGIMQQFETILSKSSFSKMGGVQRLFIKLNPENLGTIKIEMVQKDQTIVAKILTTTQTAKDILESNLNNLKESFNAQNIHVDKLEITSTSQPQAQQDSYLKRDQQSQHGQNYQEQGQNKQHEEESDDDFTLSLEQALINTKA